MDVITIKQYKINEQRFKEVYKMLNKIWRYSINRGDFGGIVIADTMESAEQKVRNKYNDGEICVWKMTDDDYFDENNFDVFECY